MDTIRDNILRCLDSFRDEDKLLAEFDKIIENVGNTAYSIIINILTHLDLETDEAKEVWNKVVLHWRSLGSTLGREVSLRTAICDYFCSIDKSLNSPVVVEIQIFEKVIRDSKYDQLTGLFNRRSFDEILAREIARSLRHKTELSLLFIDIDDFKSFNDTYGHQFGDEVLKQVAEIVFDACRTEDIAARYGGEEIVVIMPQTPKIDGLVLGERIRKNISNLQLEFEKRKIGVTISGGLASLPENAQSASELTQCADSALYYAKGAGKNQIALYSSHDRRRFQRIDLDRDIQIRDFSITDRKINSGKTKDISIGGILFNNSYPIDIGTKIQLTMALNEGKPIDMLGAVARVEAFGPEEYKIGVMSAFMQIEKEVKNEVTSYLFKHIQN